MSLTTGTRLGPYEIVTAIGAGGMGEVYRARDTKLHREVAIKVLPELFAADPDRLARFEREAQSLAALNHPNIAQVYGQVELPADMDLPPKGGSYGVGLVMELVDGEDLSRRIARGAVPLNEAIAIARQIADALEAAHDRGIVHRDLKPANIKVREDGTVKVLDFGLAKAVGPVEAGFTRPVSGPAEAGPYDTFTSPAMTGMGVILGTAAYMSPEQAKGKPVDKRADIWAFGAVLYEMLTGRAPFAGDSMTEVLGAVVLKEPDWTLLPPGTPTPVRELLHRCLEKDPKNRLRDVGDAAYELTRPRGPAPSATARRPAWIWTAALTGSAAVLASALTWTVLRSPAETANPSRRFAVSGLSPLLFDAFQTLAISPDGNALTFRGRGPDGVERIYVREFDSLEHRGLPGTEGGRMPFFSPDGRWIGFFTGNALKKVSIAGGPAQTLAPAAGGAGAAWMDDGTIVFVGDPVTGLQRVSSSGGPVETLLPTTETARNTWASPWALPGSKAILLLKRTGIRFDLAALSLEDKQVRVLAEDAYSPTFIPTGHLLFHQGDAILAVRFDPVTLQVSGTPFPVAQGLGNRLSYQSRLFTVALDGTLVYVPTAPAGEAGWSMVLVDREGKQTPIAVLDRQADTPRFSPDGTRVAFRTPAPNCDVWVRDLARGATTRVTKEGDNHGVVWRPDGARVISARIAENGTEIIALPADGAGPPERLFSLPGAVDRLPTSWSAPNGALILQDRFREKTGTDIVAIPFSGGAHKPLLGSDADEGGGMVSPDGQLVAYVSDESGRNEVYLRRYSGEGERTLVSTNGGIEPIWSRNGDELFYRNARDVLVVNVKAGVAGPALVPRVLFSGDYPFGPQVANYDIAPDGKRFLMMRGRQWPEGQVVVIENWFNDVRSKAR